MWYGVLSCFIASRYEVICLEFEFQLWDGVLWFSSSGEHNALYAAGFVMVVVSVLILVNVDVFVFCGFCGVAKFW